MQTASVEKQAYSVSEFLEAFSIGRTFFYDQVNAGTLKTIKIGGKTLIRSEDARAWLDQASNAAQY